MIGQLGWNERTRAGKDSNKTDEALMLRVVRQDRAALEVLYDRHSGSALRLATRILGDKTTGEEIVQEAFWRVWQRARTFRDRRGQFASWLLSIVHHLAIDEVRRRGVRPAASKTFWEEGSLTELPDLYQDVAGTALRNITCEQVRAAVARLPDPQRHVLELAYFQGLTHHEISEQLGEPLGTIHTRTRLGLLKLREHLALVR